MEYMISLRVFDSDVAGLLVINYNFLAIAMVIALCPSAITYYIELSGLSEGYPSRLSLDLELP